MLNFSVLSHTGLVFCRYIYIRYPEGLLVEGKSYLKIITIVFVSLWSVLNIVPYISLFRKEEFIPNTMKGLICAKAKWDNSDEEFRKVVSVKPKLYIWMTAFIFGFYIIWMFRFSRRHSKRFSISKYRRHLYSLTSQTVIATSICLGIIIEQVLNVLIELNYEYLGPDGAFIAWWALKMLENILFFVVKNIWLLYIIVVKHPEVCEYEGRQFPAQERPRTFIPGHKKIAN